MVRIVLVRVLLIFFLIGTVYVILKRQRWRAIGFRGFFGELPDLVNFVYWCRKQTSQPLAFIARDGFLLDKIHKRIFPGFRSDYVFCSRDTLLAPSPSYLAYATRFIGHAWVDVQSSNRSFQTFFQRHFPRAQRPLFLIYSAALHSYRAENFEGTRVYAKLAQLWPEPVARAPHYRIRDVREDGTPVYALIKGNFDPLEIYARFFALPHYERTLALLLPGTLLRTEHELLEPPPPKIEAKRGVLALDLDGTVVNTQGNSRAESTSRLVKSLCEEAFALDVDVVVITARKRPFLDHEALGLPHGLDIYYNVEHLRNRAAIKARQLGWALERLPNKLSRDRAMLVDDEYLNVEAARAEGFSACLVASNNLCASIETVRQFLRSC